MLETYNNICKTKIFDNFFEFDFNEQETENNGTAEIILCKINNTN